MQKTRITSVIVLALMVLASTVPANDLQGWQEERERIDEETNRLNSRAKRTGIFIAASVVTSVAGVFLAANGYDEEENIKSMPMVARSKLCRCGVFRRNCPTSTESCEDAYAKLHLTRMEQLLRIFCHIVQNLLQDGQGDMVFGSR